MKDIFRSRGFWILGLLITVIIALIIYTSSGRGNVTIAEKIAADIMAPFYNAASGVSDWLDSISSGFSDKEALQQEIDQLKLEYMELQLENQQLVEYRYEARRLAKAMEFQQANLEYFDLELTRVIARSNQYWYQTLTVNKGEANGIQVNMIVINGDGLVGKVVSVSHWTSQVMLLTDPQLAVGVAIQENRECNGIIEGLHETKTLRLANMPFYSNIKSGQTVITSGLSDYYPKGIKVGTINRVLKDSNGLTLSAAVDPAVDFDRLEELFIVTAYRQRSDEEIDRLINADQEIVDGINSATAAEASNSKNDEDNKIPSYDPDDDDDDDEDSNGDSDSHSDPDTSSNQEDYPSDSQNGVPGLEDNLTPQGNNEPGNNSPGNNSNGPSTGENSSNPPLF